MGERAEMVVQSPLRTADAAALNAQLWEYARVLASLLFSNMRNIEDVTVK
jgi:hypothetical protein